MRKEPVKIENTAKCILKKYEGDTLFEVIIFNENSIEEVITDKEQLNAFK